MDFQKGARQDICCSLDGWVWFVQQCLWFGGSVFGTFVPLRSSQFSSGRKLALHWAWVFAACVHVCLEGLYRGSWMNGCFMRPIRFISGLSSEISVPECTQTLIKGKLLLFLKTRKGVSLRTLYYLLCNSGQNNESSWITLEQVGTCTWKGIERCLFEPWGNFLGLA